MDAFFRSAGFAWNERVGVGFYPVREFPYDQAYFAKYLRYETTQLGRELTRARVALVDRYTDGVVLDVGVGSGAFVKARPNTFGYDVNPSAVQYLRALDRFAVPADGWEAMTFWDSLEHIADFQPLLAAVRRLVFVATPIYADRLAAVKSKHFRPDEHFWYWTRDGLRRHLGFYDFDLVEEIDTETRLGREAIGTFVFRRRGAQ